MISQEVDSNSHFLTEPGDLNRLKLLVSSGGETGFGRWCLEEWIEHLHQSVEFVHTEAEEKNHQLFPSGFGFRSVLKSSPDHLIIS